ncbi:MAG: hypothetical protein RR131_03645, partial [Anaerovorax sp.]
LGKNVKITFEDEIIIAKVIGHTSELDNEPDDDGNYGGEYIEVKVIKSTKHFDVGGELAAHLYEIKSIEIIE